MNEELEDYLDWTAMNKPVICNFCFLEDLRQFAAQHQGELTIDEDEEGGVTVRINGAAATAFARMPTACVCGGIRAVHILLAGRALCGMPGVPKDWPPGHRWVSMEERNHSTCLTCQIVSEDPFAVFMCPRCSGSDFLEGPHGGLSINFCCARCGARFNDMVGWIEEMPADGNERKIWAAMGMGGKYRPRASKLKG